jgi:two-component system phosphate regulon response regulator OmpR
MTTQILLVDDDFELRELVREYLGRYGIEVSVLHDASHLENTIKRERPDMIILDVLMPGIDGLTALRRLRGSGDDVPVIMLSARAEDVDRIAGLDLGADDYIGKPFNPRELLARVSSVLRCRSALPPLAAAPEQRKPFAFGRFVLDFQTRTLSTEHQALRMTIREFALLKIFVDHPMLTLTRGRLIGLLHGLDGDHADRGIDVQVWRLRKILESNSSSPRLIQTVRGRGYVFVPDGERGAPAAVQTTKMIEEDGVKGIAC